MVINENDLVKLILWGYNKGFADCQTVLASLKPNEYTEEDIKEVIANFKSK